jgi:hypothetical protein
VAVALHQQAVAFDVDAVASDGRALPQQSASGIVGEAFRGVAAYCNQAIQRVVVEALAAFARIVDAGQVAIGVVSIMPLQYTLLFLT